MEQRIGPVEDRLLIDGDPEVGRIGAQSFAEETGRRNADDGDGVVRDDERRANNGGVGAVLLLPGAVGEHGNRLRVGLIVGGDNGAAGEGAESEGGEVVAGDHLGAEGLGGAIGFAAANAQRPSAGLEGGEGGELRRVLLHLAVEVVREESPFALGVAFNAAVVAFADAVEAGGVCDGEGLEHDGVDEGEDGRRGADAESQREHGGEGEDGGQAHLAQGIGEVLA